MNKFARIAQETTSLSPLMQGRDKIQMEELMKEFPNGVTVMEFDMVESDTGAYPVFTIAENPHVFACGGRILANICLAWTKDYHGDIEAASNELKAAGGVKMRFYAGRTKTGNNLTKVEILD